MSEDNNIVEEQTLDIAELESQVASIVDESTLIVNNENDSAAGLAEDALKDMQTRLDTLEDTNARLTNLVGKMVSAYGARLNEQSSQGVEAFPPSSVEPILDQSDGSTVPNLSDIVLGS